MMKVIVKILIVCAVTVVMAACSRRGYSIYQFDNGDDYLCEGLRRIVSVDGKIGFADSLGHKVIDPQFVFAFPFENGVSRATMSGYSESDGEHSRWVSDDWFLIDRQGRRVENDFQELERRLNDYAADKDARIGVAVIIDGRDTVSVNGSKDFPMMSVFKFPQALAVAEYCREHNINLSDTISLHESEIKTNTWSPMRDKYGVRDLNLPISELLDYSVRQSDNNACDVLFRLIGGTSVADSIVRSYGIGDIVIGSTEDEMHQDIYLCYLNRSTPIAMAQLLDMFDKELRVKSTDFGEIAWMMEHCATGNDRILSPLSDQGVLAGHKTGTGDLNSQGRIIGVNDAGYVHLPEGPRYSIAVFVADSAYGIDETSAIIAEISKIVYEYIKMK